MNKDIDKLDGLREIRQKTVRKCGNDPKVMGDYFRGCQKQYEDRIIADINVANSSETILEKVSA